MIKYLFSLFFLFVVSSLSAQPVKVVSGMIANNARYDEINADKVLNAIRSTSGNVTIKFPAGKYYIGKTIHHIEPYYSNRKLHIHIPQGTQLVATKKLNRGSILAIHHRANDSFSRGEVCIFGGNTCTSSDKKIGGVLDVTNSKREGYGFEAPVDVGNFKQAIIQGLRITGNSSTKYSDISKRKSDGASGIAGTGKYITIRFNHISNFGDAGIYLSGKHDNNGREMSVLANIYNNTFNNISNAIGVKRTFKKALIRWNNFNYNTSDISATTVSVNPTGAQERNPKPGQEIIAYGNTSRNLHRGGQFFLSNWGKRHRNSNGTYRPSHHIHNNKIYRAYYGGIGCNASHPGGVFKLFNTEFAHIANNYIEGCSTGLKAFSISTKPIKFAGVSDVTHSRCNTITNNTIKGIRELQFESTTNNGKNQSTHANLYTNNKLNTSSTDVFYSGGKWSSAKATTVSRNGSVDCVQSVGTGNYVNNWFSKNAELLGENLLFHGSCSEISQVYPCDHIGKTRPK